MKEKYKIKINPHVYQGSNFPYDRRNIDLLNAIYGNRQEIYISTLYIYQISSTQELPQETREIDT